MKKQIGKAFVAAAMASTILLALALLGVADVEDQYSDWGPPVSLGPTINTTIYLEQGGSTSKNGLSLYLSSDRPGLGLQDIYVCQRASVNDPWGAPQNLGPNVNTSFNEINPVLSLDGHRLYFQSNRPNGFGGSDIYVSRRANNRDDFGWQPPENLGAGVNTFAQEQQPFIFEDDATGVTTLFFVSNRPGGMGGFDIYASTLQPDETFGPAVLVAELSSPWTDRGPGLRRDGLEVFIASDRPGTLGGDDLWVATRSSTSDPWSLPVNLGPVVNSAAFFELMPRPSFDGTALYFSGSAPTNTGLDLFVTTRTKLKEQ